MTLAVRDGWISQVNWLSNTSTPLHMYLLGLIFFSPFQLGKWPDIDQPKVQHDFRFSHLLCLRPNTTRLRGVGIFSTFSFRGILSHISLDFLYWMTVDSEIFMPKSKAPKMDDLDYSKWTSLLAVSHRLSLASCGYWLLVYLLWCDTLTSPTTMVATVDSAYVPVFIKTCARVLALVNQN